MILTCSLEAGWRSKHETEPDGCLSPDPDPATMSTFLLNYERPPSSYAGGGLAPAARAAVTNLAILSGAILCLSRTAANWSF